MKKTIIISLLLLVGAVYSYALDEIRPYNQETGEKGLYLPAEWKAGYSASTGEYNGGGVYYSLSRTAESENFVIFWDKGYGTTAPNKLSSSDFYYVDLDYMLQQAERFYKLYSETLGFVNPETSTTMSKYKCMICLIHTTDWMAYGGGYDFVIPALWINPSTCKPIGHTVAHEIGHSFHYMCFSEASNHKGSSTINTGFHLACGNGQAIWEQTAQWQAAQCYPAEMFGQSYPLFGNNANYAFSHEWMRYQSYWFHYYLCQYYDDMTMVGQVWNTPMTGQTEGNGTDFCQAYIKLKGLTAEGFFERYFDYAMRCATFDFDAAASYRDNYIGKYDYHAVQLDDNKYQVAYASAPQCSGFNVIELSVPQAGTEITTKFTALVPGCKLADGDKGEYNNGIANALVSAGVTNYNSVSLRTARGFRVGYVFLKKDKTREYYNDNTVHCKGTAEVMEEISAKVPANTSRIFLVVVPALTTYIAHKWDDDIKNDDQWPYQFELTGTEAKNITPYMKEPEFEKLIDGRNISNVTLAYNVVLPPTNGYDGATVNIQGSAMNALCTAFQMEEDAIFSKILTYSSKQNNGTVMNLPANADGTLQNKGKTTNGDFGHWFNANGKAIDYGNGGVAYAEFVTSSRSATIGQFPGANSNGTKRTVREALRYIDADGNKAIAYLVFNITFKTGVTPYSHLASINYEMPEDPTIHTAVQSLAQTMQPHIALKPGTTATYTLTDDDVASMLSALSDVNIRYMNDIRFSSPMTSIQRLYIHYYALSGEPQLSDSETDNNAGTLAYYFTAPMTTVPSYEGQFTYFYDAAGNLVDDAGKASITVAYNQESRTYTICASDDCPYITFTLWYCMARRINKIFVGYYPLTITVTADPNGIHNLLSTSGRAADANIFDFSGRRIANPSILRKGIYILGGRKILVK